MTWQPPPHANRWPDGSNVKTDDDGSLVPVKAGAGVAPPPSPPQLMNEHLRVYFDARGLASLKMLRGVGAGAAIGVLGNDFKITLGGDDVLRSVSLPAPRSTFNATCATFV